MVRQDRQWSKSFVTSWQKHEGQHALVRWSCLVFILLFSSFWLAACGGDGEDTGTPPPTSTTPTATPVPGVSTAAASVQATLNSVTQVVDRVRGSDDSGTSAVRAVNTARLQDLGLTMQRFDTAIRTEATGTPRVATPCANGGTIDITGTTTVFTNCRTLIDTNGDGQTDAAQVLNGSLDVSVTSSTLSIVTNTLTTSITSLANNRVLERTTLNITVTGTTHSSSACRGVTVPTALTLVLNGTFSLQLDIDGNGTLEVDTSSQAQGFTIMSRINTFDPNLCIPRDLSASVSGQLSVTDNLNSNASFTLISSPSNPLTISVSTITGGVNITLRGSFSTSAPCFTGSLTVDTPTPLFFPTTTFNISGECPTAGVLTVTGSQIGTIRYTPTGGVTIDNGSDGSIDQTFNTCDDAKACL